MGSGAPACLVHCTLSPAPFTSLDWALPYRRGAIAGPGATCRSGLHLGHRPNACPLAGSWRQLLAVVLLRHDPFGGCGLLGSMRRRGPRWHHTTRAIGAVLGAVSCSGPAPSPPPPSVPNFGTRSRAGHRVVHRLHPPPIPPITPRAPAPIHQTAGVPNADLCPSARHGPLLLLAVHRRIQEMQLRGVAATRAASPCDPGCGAPVGACALELEPGVAAARDSLPPG